MAHELRTPLSGVRGEAELALRASRTDAELRAALEAVLAGTDRMAAVIDTLLAAARSDGVRGSSDAVAADAPVERLVRPSAEAHERGSSCTCRTTPLTVGAGEERRDRRAAPAARERRPPRRRRSSGSTSRATTATW